MSLITFCKMVNVRGPVAWIACDRAETRALSSRRTLDFIVPPLRIHSRSGGGFSREKTKLLGGRRFERLEGDVKPVRTVGLVRITHVEGLGKPLEACGDRRAVADLAMNCVFSNTPADSLRVEVRWVILHGIEEQLELVTDQRVRTLGNHHFQCHSR